MTDLNFEDLITNMLDDNEKQSVQKVISEKQVLIKKEVPATALAVPENTVKYKTLLGHAAILTNKQFDPNIKVLDKNTIEDELLGSVPALQINYVLTRNVALPILMAWEMGENVLLTGPTGSGKSSVVKQLCAITNRPFVRINSSGDMDSSHLFGSLVVENGATVWKDGPVTECVKYGGVLLWDEWDVSPPEINMAMQWLLESGGMLVIKEMPGTTKERTITPHKDFRIVCSGNTLGQGDDTASFAGTEVQNSASLDRFGTTVVVDYLAQAQEKRLMKKEFPELTSDTVDKLVRLGKLVRVAFADGTLSTTMSPRTLAYIAKKVTVYGDLDLALQYSYTDKLDLVEKRAFAEISFKVFGNPTLDAEESASSEPLPNSVENT